MIDVKKDYISLTGVERVALLLLSLGEEQVQKIFGLLEETEIRDIAFAMSNLGKVSSNIVEIMFNEFVEQLSTTGTLVGTVESTRRLLSKALPEEKLNALLNQISGPAGRTMWDKLSNVNEELLANYLKSEYPQTIAVVLSRIRPEHAARVLTMLPEGLVMEVVMRMLRMETVRRDILEDIEKTLRTEFTSNVGKTARRDSYESMAEIFNFMDRQTETKFLTSLDERNQEAADKIRSLMFTFEDIAKLDPKAIQAIIRVADKTKLALALKGATETMKDLFLKGMSERAGKILREDMEAMGMVRVRDVEDAQSTLVLAAKELSNTGEIMLRPVAEEEEAFIG